MALEVRFAALFRSHYDEVLAYCLRRLGHGEADDATSETFAVAWRRVDDLDWETARPWLYGVARGVLANRERSRARRKRLSGKLLGLGTSPVDAPEVIVVRSEQDAEVMAAVAGLNPRDREILLLSVWEELTAREIGVALDISTAAAEQRLHRAKKRFARTLDGWFTTAKTPPDAAQEGGRR